jgi:hypothetical protein
MSPWVLLGIGAAGLILYMLIYDIVEYWRFK